MAVHMRNGIQYGGIPNGTVKGTTPSTVPTTVKQLNQIGTVGDIAPVTIPSAVKFSNGNTLETAIGSVATIETSPAVATHAIGDYVFYNGQLYEVIAAIAVGETLVVGTNVSARTVGEELTALNNGLTSIKTLDDFIGYKDRTVSNISISSDNGYASLGDVYTNWGLPSGAYVLGFFVRGWSSAPGTFSLASSSDGRSLYTYCAKAGTIGYLSIRVWYAKF